MLNVLLVSISSPPKSDPESIQVGRYIKYLVKNDCSIDLITSKNPTLYMETDPALVEYSKGLSNTHEIKLLENRYLNYLIRAVNPSWLQYPDPKWSFFLRKYTPTPKPDIIYSRSYPLSSTLLALKIKKQWPDIPWVLHLSDPWSVSYKGPSPATNFNEKPRRWNNKKEKECFSMASKISLTSDKTVKLYQSVYPEFKNKFIITPNVFDDENLNNCELKMEGNLNIVYTGGFGEKRHPDFFLKGIQSFLEIAEDAKKNVNFIFTGPMTRPNQYKFESFSHLDQVKHFGVVSYDQMLKLQREAHILVNIDSNITDSQHSVFFPSKLLEYFAAKRRILAIGTKHSVTHDIVTQSHGDFIEIDDDQGLRETLILYWEKFRNRDKEFFSSNQEINQYGAQYNAMKLKEEFDQVISQES